MKKRFDLVGIGNAIVDVIAQSDDAFLDEMKIQKGIMQLIERDRAETLYGAMEARTQTPGGSVANSIAGAGALGLTTAFIGRVRDDALGRFYASAMTDAGITFANAPAEFGEHPTSRSMIFLSPDGERSMNTYLGISADLGPEDVDESVAGEAALMYLEGYLFDKDDGKDAFRKAAHACHTGGGRCGITLSDPFCVDRHRADFLGLIEHEMDFVFGNEHEICSLFETDRLEDALRLTAGLCDLVICTRSGDGVSVMENTRRTDIPVQKTSVVDATGAGDQFAAGFLFGLARGYDMTTCARMGNVAAREVISHIGPRPETDVATLLKAEGLL